MGEFFPKSVLMLFLRCTVFTACWPLAGLTVLVWDRNETLISDRPREEEAETSTSADGFHNSQRRQGRSSRARKAPAADPKLRKKLASLEESEAKTRKVTAGVKQKLSHMRKR